MVKATPERLEYLRKYREKKKAELAAKQKIRRDAIKQDKAVIEATEKAAGPSPPASNTSGEIQDKEKLLNEFLGAVGPKPNPRPIQGSGEEKPADGSKPGSGAKPGPGSPVFIKGSVFRLIGIRLNKFFETDEFALDPEEADLMAESLQGGLEYSKVTMNPWAAFGLMLLIWLLPLVWLLPEKLGWNKDKDKKKVKDGGKNGGRIKIGLRPNRFFGDKVPDLEDVLKYSGGPDPGPAVAAAPDPGPGSGSGSDPAGDIAARDRKYGLAVSYDDRGPPEDGKNNPGPGSA